MNRFLRVAISGALALNPGGPISAATECAMPRSFADPHYVLHDETKSIFWVRPMQVDADGAPNAYHRDDPHGNKGLAIEYLGNGMTILRDGEPVPFNVQQEENGAWLTAYESVVRNGWKAPLGLSVDIYGFARDRAGKVCVTGNGRLISATSLIRRTDANVCSQTRYIDALKFPGIVVPRRAPGEALVANADPEVAPPFAKQGVRRGDLAIAYNPETGIWKGAILYDTGPRELLGEGSIRLIMNLTGRKNEPQSAPETNAMGLGETYVLLFPTSGNDLGPVRKRFTPENIEKRATERFRKWGGGSIATALGRLLACAEEYKRPKQ
jgi:hypothetical protein